MIERLSGDRHAVLVPGLLCDGRLYAHQLETLTALGYQTQIADHGRADSMRVMAEALLREAPERFTLIGLSMGCYLSFEILRQAPERVERLVLMDSTARPDAPEQSAKRLDFIALAERHGLDPVIGKLAPSFLGAASYPDEGLRALVTDMAIQTGLERFRNQQLAIMNRQDSRPTLETIAVPTLVIVGAEDTLTPEVLAQEMADGIAGAEFVVIEGVGHLPTIEAPEAVSAALQDFLTA